MKGLITLDYEKANGNQMVNLTLPSGTTAKLYVPSSGIVTLNGELYYRNGEYVNGATSVEVVVK